MTDKIKNENGKSSSTDAMNPDYIKSLAEIMETHNLTKIKVEDSNIKLLLKRGDETGPITMMAAPQGMQMPQMAVPASAPANPTPAVVDTGVLVKSPMVGSIYLCPQPDSPQFTDVGKTVKEGDTILIVEAMKVMNAITAPCSGTVTKIHVQNAQPVEFDEILISIDPA